MIRQLAASVLRFLAEWYFIYTKKSNSSIKIQKEKKVKYISTESKNKNKIITEVVDGRVRCQTDIECDHCEFIEACGFL